MKQKKIKNKLVSDYILDFLVSKGVKHVFLLTGGAILTWWVIPIMLLVGFLTPWPYNYWRLKKFGIACH